MKRKIIIIVIVIILSVISLLGLDNNVEENEDVLSKIKVCSNSGLNDEITIGIDSNYFEIFYNYIDENGCNLSSNISSIEVISLDFTKNLTQKSEFSKLDLIFNLEPLIVEEFYNRNLIVPLDQYLNKEIINPLYVEYINFDGKMFSYSPTFGAVPVTFFNTNDIQRGHSSLITFEDIMFINDLDRVSSLGGPMNSIEEIVSYFFYNFENDIIFNLRLIDEEDYDILIDKYIDYYCKLVKKNNYQTQYIGYEYPADWIFSQGKFPLKIGNSFEMMVFKTPNYLDGVNTEMKAPFNPVIKDFVPQISLGPIVKNGTISFTTSEIVLMSNNTASFETIKDIFEYYQSYDFTNSLIDKMWYTEIGSNYVSFPTSFDSRVIDYIDNFFSTKIGEKLYEEPNIVSQKKNSFLSIKNYLKNYNIRSKIINKYND